MLTELGPTTYRCADTVDRVIGLIMDAMQGVNLFLFHSDSGGTGFCRLFFRLPEAKSQDLPIKKALGLCFVGLLTALLSSSYDWI